MTRGFVSGALWGTVLGVLGLGVASLVAPLPVPPVAEQKISDVPAMPVVPDETVSTSISESADQPAATREVAAVEAPIADDMGEIGGDLERPAAPPQIDEPGVMSAPSVPQQPVVDMRAEVPVYPNPQALAPIAPEAEQVPEIKTGVTVAPVLVQEGPTTPFETFAQPFENPASKPIMSVILLDEGEMPITNAALDDFPYPLSIAVDSTLPDAAARMAAYRSKGLEVLIALNLPAEASEAEVEAAFSDALTRLDQVVGVMEGTGEGFQSARRLSDQVMGLLAASGHGLVAQDAALNTMPNLARKKGIPAVHVFRDFDSGVRDARVIRRFLDQGAFKAVQEGEVIMMGRLQAETLSALILWGLQDRAAQVALSPVSAALRASE